MMVYGSVCSGIEAASVAWHPLGWRSAFFSEVAPFPRAVLAHHYPGVPIHGDFTTIREGDYAAIDVLVGGTPCQSFSVAGLRGGLDDERGNLALEFCLLARRLRPRWIVWENVPGVLSLDGGRAFASILGGLAECGYGLAYRVLDAQFVRVHGFGRAVPQRRRRVFVVGYLGDWRRAAAVLFERHSLSRHPAPRRQAGQVAAPTISARPTGGGGLGTDFDCDGGLVANIAGTLGSNGKAAGSATTQDAENGLLIAFGGNNQSGPIDVATAQTAHGGSGRFDFESETFVAHALRAEGFDASEDGTGRGTPLVPVPQGVALRGREGGATAELTGDVMTSLRTGGGGGDKPHVLAPVAFAENSRAELRLCGADWRVSSQLTTGGGKPGQGQPCIAFNARQDPDSGPVTHPLDTDGSLIGILMGWRVRRLTPTECERLQGFPDGYTAIPYRGKIAADGPRYKSLGNSMACNVMRWLGKRIEMVEAING